MTDKTLQDRLRFELSRIADEECYDGGSHQLMFLRQSEARELRDALDAQAERIKALEGALRDTAMMLEHAITGRNGERYGFIETRSGSMMHAQGVVEKLRALLGEK